jgi:CBS domain-containing protein
MQVLEVMTRRVISITPHASVAEAVRTMLDNSISGLLVLDDSRNLVGIITEGDLIRRTELGTEKKRTNFVDALLGADRSAREYLRVHGQRVEDVMTKDPVVIEESSPLTEAVELMERYGIRRLPVIRKGKVVGVLARSDLLRVLLRGSGEVWGEPASDDTIRVRLLELYSREQWAPLSQFDVDVRDGVVEVRGAIDSLVKHRAIIVLAKSVPGIKGVRDCLVDMPVRIVKH